MSNVPVTKEWHALEARAVPLLLEVDPKVGLTTSQVNDRQRLYGRNTLQKIKSRPAWRLLIDQFANIVIALLGTVKPSATDWIVIGCCGLLAVGIVEVTKLVFRRRRDHRLQTTEPLIAN